MANNNRQYFAGNTPFEWGIFAAALVVIVVNLVYRDDESVTYYLSALLYALTGIGMISKTSRARGFISNKIYRISMACIAFVFVAAGLTILTEDKSWNLLWLAALIVFGVVGRRNS
ncbi:hypothetical protein [Aridibaculum aurantiacum]|uniref:hypothetical protein n=1 Tax=Aridibaculum aurantiacum TaxID=2810307 RepID=UPI001A97867B|nr:hypothetical protein [Aridibaculum aurantiacum]